MPRRRDVAKRKVMPDQKYNNVLIARFINNLLKRGKKSVAESILYDSLDLVEERMKESPLSVFERALENVKPVLEVKSKRVGGATYQVPTEVRPDRRIALAIRWIIGNAKSRPGRSMEEKLAAEFMDAASNRGASVKKREDTHKMAEANKAFAHYRF
ncbi:MAG: 30S ribosomal protein S7 [Syntrophales bacterium]|nr:30S ribosomal protein S7 [Syntrophales bacterium]MCK9527859.1 30S ribosomal protein S7 [Syntrophales bacterium]MDX9921967.1 30S ribosomal protein S7 [Syntrophales bacterium]